MARWRPEYPGQIHPLLSYSGNAWSFIGRSMNVLVRVRHLRSTGCRAHNSHFSRVCEVVSFRPSRVVTRDERISSEYSRAIFQFRRKHIFRVYFSRPLEENVPRIFSGFSRSVLDVGIFLQFLGIFSAHLRDRSGGIFSKHFSRSAARTWKYPRFTRVIEPYTSISVCICVHVYVCVCMYKRGAPCVSSVYIFFIYIYIFLVVGIYVYVCGYFLSSNLHVLIPRYHS